jgi:hypothetical protein
MEQRSEQKFNSPSHGKTSFKEVVISLAGYMKEAPNEKYRVTIGSDSHTNNLENTHKVDFITAIVIHRLGRGGRYFWRKETKDSIYTLRQKIYEETNLSLATAQKLLNSLNNYLENEKRKPQPKQAQKKDGSFPDAANPQYELEIHVDIGQEGPTREMIKEIVGMVNGFGFHARTKPESYAASKVADKYT